MKRIISLFVAVIMTLSAIALLPSCSDKKDLEVVGKVGEYEVYYEELRWLTMQFKDRLSETYGEDIWDTSESAEKYRAELESAVYSSIVSNYAILTLCDELSANGEKFIDINGEQETAIIDQYIDETIEEFGSRAAYRQGLKKNYMTENLYRFITGVDVCEGILFNYYCSLGLIENDDYSAIISGIEESFIRTVHVYVEHDEGESIEDNRALANAIHQKLLAGESMSDLITKYSEDGVMSASTGYYFTNGTYSETYENAAFALGVGEFSGVVETYSGFYIIQRLELESAYIMSNFNSLKSRYQLSIFDKYIDECKATLSFAPNEYGASIDLVNMK